MAALVPTASLVPPVLVPLPRVATLTSAARLRRRSRSGPGAEARRFSKRWLLLLGPPGAALRHRHWRCAKRCSGRLTTTQLRATAVATPSADLTEVSEGQLTRNDIRNLAIIAHVDHGKTTLTDALMTQCGNLNKGVSMDSNQIEMERGITILAKNAAIRYKGVKVNLIDTPGHADFGGEVERILNMADGCLLLVDAQEGPMPQTKFVLRKALELEKRTIVVINKVDKPAARPDWVLDTTFDLFAQLGANDFLCDFPVCYASGIQGKAGDAPDGLEGNLDPLLDQILEEVPKPKISPDTPLQMLVANLDYDNYVGQICIGRVTSGSLQVGQEVGFQYGEDGELRLSTISKLWEFDNNERVEVDRITAGDICGFSGMAGVSIGDTVVDPVDPRPLPPIIVEEPTVVMEFSVNRSPLAGKAASSVNVTASAIQKRLEKECLSNLALRMEMGPTAESFMVKGRGTLQLGILMENMRREGYEIMVSAPQVLYRRDPDTGIKQEPFEEAAVEVPSEFQGTVMEEFNKKGGVMKSMEDASVEDSLVMSFEIPTKNLIGMQGRLLQKTRGQAVFSSRFSHWGDADHSQNKLRERGSIITVAAGKATTFALGNMSSRGIMFVGAGAEVYEGMCIGIHNKQADLECNITKDKPVSNVRASGSARPTRSQAGPTIVMNLDEFLGHMDTDEVLEITPGALRLAKKKSKALRGL